MHPVLEFRNEGDVGVQCFWPSPVKLLGLQRGSFMAGYLVEFSIAFDNLSNHRNT